MPTVACGVGVAVEADSPEGALVAHHHALEVVVVCLRDRYTHVHPASTCTRDDLVHFEADDCHAAAGVAAHDLGRQVDGREPLPKYLGVQRRDLRRQHLKHFCSPRIVPIHLWEALLRGDTVGRLRQDIFAIHVGCCRHVWLEGRRDHAQH